MHSKTCVVRLCALALSLAPCLAIGVTFKVNNTQDFPDANPGDGVCSYSAALDPNIHLLCTLRAAVMEGNATPLDQSVDVELKPGTTYTITIAGPDDDAEVGDLDIKRPITVGIPEGASPRARVDANHLSRAFHLLGNADNSILRGIEITNGFVATGEGVAVLSDVPGARLINLDVHGNTAGDEPGVLHCVVDGDVSIIDSRIHANGTPENGVRGVCGDAVTIVGSTIDNNLGRGIDIQSGSLRLFASTVSANDGLGVYLRNSSALIFNSTIALNASNQINFHSTDAETFSLQMQGSLLKGDGTHDVCDTTNHHPDATVTFDTSWNVYSDLSCISDTVVDNSEHNASIELSALGDWGGLTPTHLPAENSIAVDRAPASVCLGFSDIDQRGLPRPVAFSGDEARCDIGAVELQPSDNPDLIFSDSFEAL